MADFVDKLVQKTNVLHAKVLNYQTELAAYGVTAEELASMETVKGELIAKDTVQKEAINAKTAKTRVQDEILVRAQAALKRIKSIAKIAYQDDRAVWPEFHIGGNRIYAVKTMLTELVYMKELCTRRNADLSARGLTADNLAELSTLVAELEAADNDQEISKREQAAITIERKEIAKRLKKINSRINQCVEVCFAGNEAILAEFRNLG